MFSPGAGARRVCAGADAHTKQLHVTLLSAASSGGALQPAANAKRRRATFALYRGRRFRPPLAKLNLHVALRNLWHAHLGLQLGRLARAGAAASRKQSEQDDKHNYARIRAMKLAV